MGPDELERAMTPATLADLVDECFDRYARDAHYGYEEDGAWRTLATAQVRARTEALTWALAAAGIGAGDRVAIISPTRLEWALADYAILRIGAVVVPLYPSLAPEPMAYVLEHAGARLAFVAGDDEWQRLATVRSRLSELERVVSFDAVAGDEAPEPLTRFVEGAVATDVARPSSEDLASIIYTSGTTGAPKGVMLTHKNMLSNVLACTEACPFRSDDLHMSFLPLSHVFERMVHYYMLWNGVTVYFAGDLKRVKENIGAVRPTVLTSVPRVFEKVLGAVEEKSRQAGLKARLTRFGIDVARRWARAEYGDGDASLGLRLQHAVADRLVLSKIRAVLGGRLRMVVTGGAATPASVTEFFNGVGIRLLPGYGLTESSPVIAFNTEPAFRFGSVGRPIPGNEVRIADDGEILAHGPNVMRGYYRDDEATAATITDDGWLLTGDVGELDGDGYLTITDRKKDILVTAGGKNVAPQPIEQRLIQDAMINQAMLVGDGQPFVAVVIVPDLVALGGWARERGIAASDAGALVQRAEIVEYFEERVAICCSELSRFETPRKVALVPDEFSEANGELTPTLKVKRRVVMERRRSVIESLYA